MELNINDLTCDTFINIKYPELYEKFKQHERSFWKADDIKFENEKKSFETLDDDEKEFIRKIITFFLLSDAIVIDSIMEMEKHINVREVKAFYGIQNHIENVHIESYTQIFKEIITENNNETLNRINSMKSVLLKRFFCKKYNMQNNITKLLIANIFVEGVFFASSFSGILWLKKRGICPSITQANEYIARDEAYHWKFGCEIFNTFHDSNLPYIDKSEIYNIAKEVFEIEKDFVNDILPKDLGIMTKYNLVLHIKYCINTILKHINMEPLYNDVNSSPFPFMNFLDNVSKQNFFEGRATNYTLESCPTKFSFKQNSNIEYKPIE